MDLGFDQNLGTLNYDKIYKSEFFITISLFIEKCRTIKNN